MADETVSRAVIFDGDDTLWDTQPLYTASKRRFYETMSELGFPRDEVSATFEEIDQANVSRFGFSKLRFPQSMQDTYIAMCSRGRKHVDAPVLDQVQQIGASVFDESPTILEGVEDVLSALKESGVKLFLMTKGDPDIQNQRVRASGLRKYFNAIYITLTKDSRDFQDIISEEGLNLGTTWSVGNSARSDVNPAIAAGLKAIWIPRETWRYEEARAVDSEYLHVVATIRDVPSIVLTAA